MGRTNKRYADLPVFSSHPLHHYPNHSVGRFKISFLAEQLTKALKEKNIKKAPLLVLPLFELDHPNSISSFGCFFSEQMKSELYLNGFRILPATPNLEERLYNTLKKTENGFLLSKDTPFAADLSSLGIESIILGSYLVGMENIYLNVQIISLNSSEIISIGTCEIKKSKDLMDLIERRKLFAFQKTSEKGKAKSGRSFTIKGTNEF